MEPALNGVTIARIMYLEACSMLFIQCKVVCYLLLTAYCFLGDLLSGNLVRTACLAVRSRE